MYFDHRSSSTKKILTRSISKKNVGIQPILEFDLECEVKSKDSCSASNIYVSSYQPIRIERFCPHFREKWIKTSQLIPILLIFIFSYNNVTIGKYGEHSVEPYDRARAIRKKEAEIRNDFPILFFPDHLWFRLAFK